MRPEILVTGGAGMIGSAVIHRLNLRGINSILVADSLKDDGRFKNLVPLDFMDYLESDRLMEVIESGDRILNRVNTIIHLGACSDTTKTDARYLIQNNYEYSKKLASWAVTRGCRFVYASSAATYGAQEQPVKDNDDEIEYLRPMNMYAYSKQLFDRYALQQGWFKHIAGLKFFNVFGPNEYHKKDMQSMVYKAYHQIKRSGKVQLYKSEASEYEDGKQMRDFLYVKDAAAMTLFFAMDTLQGGIFNVGRGEANTWLDLINPVFEAMGKEPKIQFVPLPEPLKDAYQYYTCADTGKLKEAGFDRPIIPLKEAVTDYVQNYLMTGEYLGEE